ncbi:MAG TPA: PLP-dependent transferase [Candidatus Dormibacteraeota bacterium]|nr:PLP-dependent transferase [Candidatus Dormibacteraeota bacterium]
MATRVVHGSGFKDDLTGAVVPPLAVSATFDHANPQGFTYGRDHNPTWGLLERAISDLEDATASVSFSSGMAGVAAVLDLVPEGGRVVAAADSYTGSRALLGLLAERGRCQVEMVDVTSLAAVEASISGASLLWLETLGNPLLSVPDLRACGVLAHAAGAIVAVDNTLATPLLCRPLNLGADVVVHSGSKYIGGHDDLMLGVVSVRDQELSDRIRSHRTHLGACPGQLEAWLALRGLRTLDVRFRRQSLTAAWLAERLSSLDGVLTVHYPGLEQHPQHRLAAERLDGGFGAMISIELGASAEATERFCSATRIWTNATSLGSVGSLLERRGRWEGEAYLPDGLVRLSVGLEDPNDLLGDLAQALAAAGAGS